MARVTVEDCIKVVSHFKLVLLAARRSKDIAAGDPPKVDRDDDKNPVLALREIASEAMPIDVLEENYIKSLQRHLPVDEENDDDLEEFMNSETNWASDENMEEELEAFSQIEDAEIGEDALDITVEDEAATL